jgi:Calx-beta domain-containing protein
VEPDEGFTVTLSNAVGGGLETTTASGTILNEDTPTSLSIAGTDASKSEGGSGNTPFTFTVSRVDGTNPASVNFAVTGSGTNAANAADFGGAFPNGTVQFAVGETSKTATINVAGDRVVEATEGFTVTLSIPVGGPLGTPTALGRIVNDDTFVVDTLVDESDGDFSPGDLSLREAIEQANLLSVDKVIEFAPALTAAGPATIKLAGTQLLITKDATIQGPGASLLSIDADHRSRVLQVTNGSVFLSGLTMTGGNSGSSRGGAILNQSQLTLLAATISGNTALDGGGGICNYGQLTVSQSTISGNTSVNFDGGGIFSSYRLTVQHSTISGNSAKHGGGIMVLDGNATVSQSTLSANIAATSGGGISNSGSLKVQQSTISGNISGYGAGGISNDTYLYYIPGFDRSDHPQARGGTIVSLTNSIVAGNKTASGFPCDLISTYIPLLTAHHNLIGSPAAAGGLMNGVNGNIVGKDFGIGGRLPLDIATVLDSALTDNGGPVWTLRLVSGSPAIDAGGTAAIPADSNDLDGHGNTSESLPFDQRGSGFARVIGGAVDIGAFEFAPTASVAVTSALVMEDGSNNLIFTLTRNVTAGPLTVNFSLSGTAVTGEDYSADATNSVMFADGASTATVTIDPTADNATEADETVIVTLLSGAGYQVGSMSVATGTILNDDASLSIAAASAVKSEGNSGSTAFSFTVTRAGDTSGLASVEFAVTGGGTGAVGTESQPTSADATDFGGALPSGSVSFAVGESSRTLTINVSGDASIESDEGFTVTLSNANAASLLTATATGTIVNDDAGLSIAATDASKREGNSGNAPFTFTVTRTGSSRGAVSANYAVRGSGTNPAATADFGGTLPRRTINFADGETSKTITINVSGNKSVEPDEDFTVTLSNPVGANLVTASATGTILNDDTALSIAATDANRLEGNSGTTPFTFTVTRTGDLSRTATVTFIVSAGGSQPADAADFGGTLSSGTLSFAIGESSKSLIVNVRGDSEIESDERFAVTLSNAVGAKVVTASATGVILSEEL